MKQKLNLLFFILVEEEQRKTKINKYISINNVKIKPTIYKNDMIDTLLELMCKQKHKYIADCYNNSTESYHG